MSALGPTLLKIDVRDFGDVNVVKGKGAVGRSSRGGGGGMSAGKSPDYEGFSPNFTFAQ